MKDKVFCKNCKYHMNRIGLDICSSGAEGMFHPVTGEKYYERLPACEDKNEKLDCKEYEKKSIIDFLRRFRK